MEFKYQLKVNIENVSFEAWTQPLVFFILDLNDFFGKPFLFNLGGDINFSGYTLKINDYPKGSTKRQLSSMLIGLIDKLNDIESFERVAEGKFVKVGYENNNQTFMSSKEWDRLQSSRTK